MHDIIFIKFLLNLVNNVEKWKILNWLEIGFMLRAELCLNDIFVSHSTSSSSLLIKQRKRGRKEGEQQQNTIERGEWNFSCKQERRRVQMNLKCMNNLKNSTIWVDELTNAYLVKIYTRFEFYDIISWFYLYYNINNAPLLNSCDELMFSNGFQTCYRVSN